MHFKDVETLKGLLGEVYSRATSVIEQLKSEDHPELTYHDIVYQMQDHEQTLWMLGDPVIQSKAIEMFAVEVLLENSPETVFRHFNDCLRSLKSHDKAAAYAGAMDPIEKMTDVFTNNNPVQKMH